MVTEYVLTYIKFATKNASYGESGHNADNTKNPQKWLGKMFFRRHDFMVLKIIFGLVFFVAKHPMASPIL